VKVKDFKGRIAVVTGGGTGMGRELARKLVAEGCHVATCDIIEENLTETLKLCQAEAAHGALVTAHPCDVADEKQVQTFRKAVEEEHQTKYINLLFNNAGVGGGGSFVESTREEWERTFNINWNGVYHFTRYFIDMLLASTEGHIINTSSVNGFRASLGGNIPHTAYSTAKFAVKGFSEGLINDFRFNAPHLKVSVVMPGHVGSEIAVNTGRIMGHKEPKDFTDEDIDRIRTQLTRMGMGDPGMDNGQIRNAVKERIENFSKGGLTPAQGADIILEGVRNEQWRILVGKDAEALDRAVRKHPLETYDLDFDKRVIENWER
jgi:NAD(P)-dependent dehydrogenase (short-subunit alcohol dehydrogenase family)